MTTQRGRCLGSPCWLPRVGTGFRWSTTTPGSAPVGPRRVRDPRQRPSLQAGDRWCHQRLYPDPPASPRTSNSRQCGPCRLRESRTSRPRWRGRPTRPPGAVQLNGRIDLGRADATQSRRPRPPVVADHCSSRSAFKVRNGRPDADSYLSSGHVPSAAGSESDSRKTGRTPLPWHRRDRGRTGRGVRPNLCRRSRVAARQPTANFAEIAALARFPLVGGGWAGGVKGHGRGERYPSDRDGPEDIRTRIPPVQRIGAGQEGDEAVRPRPGSGGFERRQSLPNRSAGGVRDRRRGRCDARTPSLGLRVRPPPDTVEGVYPRPSETHHASATDARTPRPFQSARSLRPSHPDSGGVRGRLPARRARPGLGPVPRGRTRGRARVGPPGRRNSGPFAEAVAVAAEDGPLQEFAPLARTVTVPACPPWPGCGVTN